MSAEGGPRTRTRERYEVEVDVEEKTVEETEHRCRNCNQWYLEEDLVPFGLGMAEDGDEADEYDWLCGQCSETIFDYEPGDDITYNAALAAVDDWTGEDFATAIWGVAKGVTYVLIALAILVWASSVAIDALTAMSDAIVEVGVGASSTSSEAFSNLPRLLILIVGFWLLWATLNTGRGGS